MEENEVVVQGVELDTSVNIELPKEEVQIIETVEEISVETPEETTIDVSEVSGVIVGTGEFSEHKHAIEDVTNLVDKLKTLGAPHEVYSPNGGYAEFRKWTANNKSYYVQNIKNNNPGAIGYFAGLVEETDGNIYLDICHNTDINVYGVVVSNSAFCGYQDEQYNLFHDSNPLWFADNDIDRSDSNSNYAKVCLLGDVMTRVHSEKNFNQIDIGDYVVPDEYGCAIKSKSGIGFKVISKGETGVNEIDYKWYYVTIALVPQNDNVSRVMAELESTRDNVGNLSITIGKLENDVNNISGITGVIEDFEKEFDKYQESVDKKLSAAEEANTAAKEVASSAQTAIQDMNAKYVDAAGRAEAAATNANTALGNIAQMREDLNVLYDWNNGDSRGIQGFVNEIGKLGTLQQQVNENQADISSITQTIGKDGAAIQLLVARADLYSVGKYSQTSGLSYSEAQGILDNGGFIYVHIGDAPSTETSHIYRCTQKADISADDTGYFAIGEVLYSFKVPYALGSGDTYEYNARTKKLIINKETDREVECKVTVAKENGGSELIFESEYTITFKPYSVYRWTNTDNGYWWAEASDIPISWSSSRPNIDDTEYMLWYCQNGILDNNQYTYLPGTLYLWDDGRWIAVASINGNTRSVSLIHQTADSLTSTITDVQGNVSDIEQTVEGIRTTVSNVDGQLSTIVQNAENIVAGTYDEEGSSSQLSIALNKIYTATSKTSNMLAGEFKGNPSNISEVTERYSQPPMWDGNEFVFSGEPVADGEYCINPDNPEQYYKLSDDGYELYIMGAQAITSLQQQVDENKSAIESFTKFDAATNTTLTRLFQESDADSAQIGSVVMGEFRERTYISLDITEDENELIGNRYTEAPTWDTANKRFMFGEDINTSENGIYCIPIGTDGSYYWKLLLDDNSIVGYEQYEMKSSGYASIMQKFDDKGGSIGFAVGMKDTDGGIFVDAINDQTTALINADKVKIYGNTTFSDSLVPGTTTISGDYISTGVLKSNNYVGPATYRMYGLTIDLENNKLIKADSSSKYVYYAPIVNGDVIFVNNTEYSICFYCMEIKEDVDLYTEKQDASEYMVSLEAFDIVPSEINIEGTKFDLNAGTIYSKNLILDPKGNLSITGKITATSGYIGDKDHGFTIGYHNTKYALSNNQDSLIGDRTGNSGVYIGPDGIGLGNGYFSIDNEGNLETLGDITMWANNTKVVHIDSDGGNLTLAGNIVLSGSITWDTSNNPVCVLYAPTALSAPTKTWLNSEGEYNYGSSSTAGVWHRIYQEEAQTNPTLQPDYYASYSYDGGKTWTNAVKIRGEDGQPGQNGNHAYVTAENVFNILTNNGGTQGLFPAFYEDEDEERLFINAEYIRSGTLSGITVESASSFTVESDKSTTMTNLTRLKDGTLSLFPTYNTKTGGASKLTLGYSPSEQEVYMLLGAGSGAGSIIGPNNLTIPLGTLLMYKQKKSAGLVMYGSDYQENVKDPQGIWFYDYNWDGHNAESKITFGNSTVDFSNATVIGLEGSTTATAVFG